MNPATSKCPGIKCVIFELAKIFVTEKYENVWTAVRGSVNQMIQQHPTKI